LRTGAAVFDKALAWLIRRALAALRARLEARMTAEPSRSLSHQIDAVLLLIEEANYDHEYQDPAGPWRFFIFR
jgi:hypothetical protein